MSNTIPYKIYLEENEMPRQWYNVRADMKNKPAPILNPATMKPITVEELSPIFCEELARQELMIRPHISTYRRRYVIFIKCIARHRLQGRIVWKRNWTHLHIFIINLRETTRREAISSTLPLRRHIMQNSRDSKG